MIHVNPIGQCLSRDLEAIKEASLTLKPDADPLDEAHKILKIARSRLYDHNADVVHMKVGTITLRFRKDAP